MTDVRDGIGSGISQNNKTGGKSLPSRSPANHDRGSRVVMGSNGNKLSKFERPDSPRNRGSNPQDSEDDSDDDEQWLCSHYKRRCHVKFHCCDKYWPCHRCHNNESKCGQKKLKSRDTKFIKCVKCGKEQEVCEVMCQSMALELMMLHHCSDDNDYGGNSDNSDVDHGGDMMEVMVI